MPLTPKAPALPGNRVLEERARGLASLCHGCARGEAGICLPSQHGSLAANAPPPHLRGHSRTLERACLAKYQLAAVFTNNALKFL